MFGIFFNSDRLNVYINGRFLTQRITGVQRFAREIVQASAEHNLLPKGTTLLAPDQQETPASFAGVPVQRAGKRGGHLWEQLELPRAAGHDLLVSLCGAAPMGRSEQLVVLHDAAVAALPQNFTLAFRLWYQLMIRAYGFRARKFATVSEFSAGEIARYFNIPRKKIEVIPESGEHILRPVPDYSMHEKFGLEQDGYFLAVSSLASNKNFHGILQAVARLPSLPYKFVIVGGRNSKIFNAANMEVTGAVEAGYATDGQLRALYERAACFVYPSTYEGFGLPPLEAMSSGCPVLVSNTTSLPEVCGYGATYCNPHDVDDIARQLLRLLESHDMRTEMREAGKKRAGEWTWQGAAKRLQEVAAS